MSVEEHIRLELIQVPVSEIDRAKDFYTKADLTLDVDAEVGGDVRFVQLTPPDSPTSTAIGIGIGIGIGLSKMKPGSIEGLQLVVTDIHVVHKELAACGVEAQRCIGIRLGLIRLSSLCVRCCYQHSHGD